MQGIDTAQTAKAEGALKRIARTYLGGLISFYREHGAYPLTYLLIPLGTFFYYSFSAPPQWPGSLAVWVAAVAATLLFLPTYWVSDVRRLRLIGMLSLGVAGSSLILPFAYLLHFLPLIAAARLADAQRAIIVMVTVAILAAINLLWLNPLLGQPYLEEMRLLFPVFLVFVGWSVFSDVSRERATAQLKLAHAEIARLAVGAERERIARDLHDLLGHSLSLITVKAELVAKLGPLDTARALAENRDVIRIAKNALHEVRQAVDSYRAPSLASELAGARLALRSAGVTLEAHIAAPVLTEDQGAALAFALREGVTNVVRHAGASRCNIRLYSERGHAVLDICDDGRGSTAPEGSGLRGMRERLAVFGGAVVVESRKGKGTRLSISLPLTAARLGIKPS